MRIRGFRSFLLFVFYFSIWGFSKPIPWHVISAGSFSSPFTSNFAPIIISLTLMHVSVCRVNLLTFIVEIPLASAMKGINWSPVWLSTGILGLSSFKRF